MSKTQVSILCAAAASALVRPTEAACTCPDGSQANFLVFPPCASGQPTGDTCQTPGQGADNQPAMPGMSGSGTATESCTTLPCKCSLLGDVAKTIVASTDFTNTLTGGAIPVDENVYGPFEAGFTEQQKDILLGLGCTESNVASAYLIGGLDTAKAEAIVATKCNVVLPRLSTDGSTYISLLDQCGGHTQEYHFHERLACLYDVNNAAGTHSPAVAKTVINDQLLYGKWEAANTEPTLDACGGHWGRTPESPNVDVYHYHIQTKAPFTIGCFGPNADNSTVTIDQCRDLYDECAHDKVTNASGEGNYTPYCPCYVDGSNYVPETYTKGGSTTPTTPTTTTGNSTTGSTSSSASGAAFAATAVVAFLSSILM